MSFRKFDSNYKPPSPASITEIDAFEKRNGIKLPDLLVNLLKTQNGGDLNPDSTAHPLLDSLLGLSSHNDPLSPHWESQIASLHDWLLARGDLNDPVDTLPELELANEDLTKLIAFSSLGTYYFLLDYRFGSTSPNVLYLDLIGGEQELEYVSDSFAALFKK